VHMAREPTFWLGNSPPFQQYHTSGVAVLGGFSILHHQDPRLGSTPERLEHLLFLPHQARSLHERDTDHNLLLPLRGEVRRRHGEPVRSRRPLVRSDLICSKMLAALEEFPALRCA
jgi:hypothetical protein